MNPEMNLPSEDRRTNPSFLRRIGETVVGIGAAYVGLKIGEDVFHFTLSYPVEMGISTAVGSGYANLERHNSSTEQ